MARLLRRRGPGGEGGQVIADRGAVAPLPAGRLVGRPESDAGRLGSRVFLTRFPATGLHGRSETGAGKRCSATDVRIARTCRAHGLLRALFPNLSLARWHASNITGVQSACAICANSSLPSNHANQSSRTYEGTQPSSPSSWHAALPSAPISLSSALRPCVGGVGCTCTRVSLSLIHI